MSKLTFDANKVKPQEALDPIPANWYLASVTKTELKPTKSDPKGGKRLEIEWTIQEGEFKGRKVFDGFNTENKNPVAAQIGQEQLSALCHATGEFKLTDTAQLHDKPHRLKVGLENARTDEKTGASYESRNVYKGCEPIEGAKPSATAGAPAWANKGAPTTVVKTPPGKTKTEPAPEPVWRLKDDAHGKAEFWLVAEEGADPLDVKVADVLEMLGKGMPATCACMLQGGDDTWLTVEDFFTTEAAEPAKIETKKSPPAKTTAASTPAKNSPPWLKK